MVRGWEQADTTALDSQDLEWPERQLFALEVLREGSVGTSWTSTGMGCSVGSHPSNDLVIDDRKVSRFHFELEVSSEGVWLRDLGSRNGTTVDSVR